MEGPSKADIKLLDTATGYVIASYVVEKEGSSEAIIYPEVLTGGLAHKNQLKNS